MDQRDIVRVKPTVYIETTVVSYLTARPKKNVVRMAQQRITKQWWRLRRSQFSMFSSQFVIDEASAGNAEAAKRRLSVLSKIDLLEIAPEVEILAQRLLDFNALPPPARVDALHLAVATINGMQYLMTWNCKHLANAFLWDTIYNTCRLAGYQPPAILTPYELLGT
jgi:hypothetical protein